MTIERDPSRPPHVPDLHGPSQEQQKPAKKLVLPAMNALRQGKLTAGNLRQKKVTDVTSLDAPPEVQKFLHNIKEDEAKKMLQGKAPGSYVIIKGITAGWHLIYVDSKGSTQKMIFRCDNDGKFLSASQTKYGSLEELAAEKKISLTTGIPTFLRDEAPLTREELDFERDTSNLLAEGLRTEQAKEYVYQFKDIHHSDEIIRVGSNHYVILSGNFQDFSETPYASCGSAPGREIITIDPRNSLALQRHFERLREELTSSLTPEQVLQKVTEYVRTKIFTTSDDPETKNKIEEMVESALHDNKHTVAHHSNTDFDTPVMSIDEFMASHLGGCRHHALVTCYFLDRLIKDSVLDGIVQHIRENTGDGAHTFVTFIPKAKEGAPAQKWLVDTQWNQVVNFADIDNYNSLCDEASYGQDAMQSVQKRTQRAAQLTGQPEKAGLVVYTEFPEKLKRDFMQSLLSAVRAKKAEVTKVSDSEYKISPKANPQQWFTILVHNDSVEIFAVKPTGRTEMKAGKYSIKSIQVSKSEAREFLGFIKKQLEV